MPELLAFLFGTFLVLAFVAVVGHGIWLAVAWSIRSLSGQQRGPAPAPQPCPNCGAAFSVHQGRCLNCGAVPNLQPGGALREELKTTARQLRRLVDQGRITPEQYDAMLVPIQEDLARTGAGVPQVQPAPQATLHRYAQSPFAAPPAVAPPVARPPAAVAPPTAPPAAAAPGDLVEILEAVVEDTPAAASPRAMTSPPIAPPPIATPPYTPRPVAPRQTAGSPFAPAAATPVPPPARPLAPPPPPPKPTRPLAEVLQSFMEESNIRWGEILAAVLIVVSSIGLVWSLWHTLNRVPYFPAVLFTAFTVAFHGAGLYTLRRWNLRDVSRVILIISLMLVPLAISGAVVLSGSGQNQRSVTDPLFVIAVLLGAAIFGWVAFTASRELVGEGKWRLTVGILGCSLSQVLIQRTELAGLGFWGLQLIAAVPLASFLVATVGQLARARDWPQISRRRAGQIFLVLGLSTFALLAALGLLFIRAQSWQTIAWLSPTLSLAAASVLALGLLVHRRTTAKSLALVQTAGTAVLLFAGLLMLLLVGFAWPEPQLLLAVGIVNAIVLAGLAIASDLALLHAPAIACAALASLMGLHLAQGRFRQIPESELPARIVEALLMGRSALVLALLAAAAAGIGLWLTARPAVRNTDRKRRETALVYLGSTGVLVAASALIALFCGFVLISGWQQDRDLAAPLLAIFAIALMVAGARLPWPAVPAIGSGLLWVALVQAASFNTTIRGWLASLEMLPTRGVLAATLIHGIAMAVVSAAAAWRWMFSPKVSFVQGEQSNLGRRLVEPLSWCGVVSLIAVVPMILWIPRGEFQWHAAAALCATVAWGLLLAARRWPWAFSALQGMLALTCGLFLAGVFREKLGFEQWPLARPHVQFQLLAFALAAGLWSIIRRLASRREVVRDLLAAPWPGVDQVLLVAAVVGLPVVEFIRTLPALGWEQGFTVIQPKWDFGNALSLSDGARTALLTVAVFAALAAALWKRVSLEGLVGLGVASSALVWTLARIGEETNSAASAARWVAAILGAVWALPYLFRGPVKGAAKHLAWLRWDKLPRETVHWFCAQPLVLFGAPILILTILAVEQSARGVALRGPLAGSLFDVLGMTVSYAGPLLVLVAVLLAYAVRDRQPGFALGGSAVFQLAINLAFLLHVSHTTGLSAGVQAIEWLQWNSIAAGAFALVWLGLSRWISPAPASGAPEPAFSVPRLMLALQIFLAAATALAVVLWAAGSVMVDPAFPPVEVAALGRWLSYLAVVLVIIAIVWHWFGRLHIGLGDAVLLLAVAFIALAACTANQFDAGRQWLAYHVLTGGWIVAGLIGVAAVCARFWRTGGVSLPVALPATPRTIVNRLVPHHLSLAALAALLAWLAIRGNHGDPGQPWWSQAATIAAFGMATALGLVRRSQLYAYTSTALAGLSVMLLWMAPQSQRGLEVVLGDDFLAPFTILIAVIAAAGLWLWYEVRAQRQKNASFSPTFLGPRVHATVACGATALFTLLLLVSLFRSPGLMIQEKIGVGITLLALGALLAACLWDRRAWFTLPLAYVWLGGVWLLAILCLPSDLLHDDVFVTRTVLVFVSLAAQVALTGQIWSYGANLAAAGTKLGISDPIGGLARTVQWLVPANLLLAGVTCLVCLSFVLTIDSDRLRVLAALAPAVAAWGVLCLAQERRRDALQLTALLMVGLTVIYLGWAQIEPDNSPATWLVRAFRLLMALAAITFAYGLLVPRFLLKTGPWNASTQRAGQIAGIAAVAALMAVLALEVALFQPGIGAPVDGVQIVAVAVVLIGLIAGLLSLALLPGKVLPTSSAAINAINPQFYVYAAEAVGVLLFAHLYVSRPMWFDVGLRPYWPLIVMAIAFLGVGASELCQRLGIRVLAEPLQRTGSLLPLLPVLGIWIVAAPQTDYALLLFVAGILYLVLSVTQKSWASLIAAGIAGNAALWVLLQRSDFNFAANPQFWLIPPALSALAAAQVNRNRLSPEALTGIRYAAAVVIYLSSTSEIFIRGVGDHLWPPMLLAGLAVVGAMLGIVLRIRAFLYLGTTFTLLALVTMVWHAARAIEHVWPWWAFGIGTGIAILILFGIFEKKRAEVLSLIARLRQWEQ